MNLVGSLQAPADTSDIETMRDEIEGFVVGLLGLVGIEADPLASREFILLANLIETSWTAGRSLDLPTLVGQVQQPPIRKLGVFDLDTFFPPADRTTLALRLNGLLASPAFAAWGAGTPLDIATLLHGPDGRPAAAIVSIAHLSDEERQFVTALLLSKVVTWMRRQSGTTDLRVLVYMDEVAGYVPPTANPPTKKPIMTLMKQARAFGVGVVLSTQNPVDLDYKAISNAGTWMVGRLQTERDKARLLEGMSAAAGTVDVGAVSDTISGLGKREFVLKRAGKDKPEVFTTRWAMSYLRGPLTRDQIHSLTAAAPATAAEPATAPGAPPATGASAAAEPAAAPSAASRRPASRLRARRRPRPALPWPTTRHRSCPTSPRACRFAGSTRPRPGRCRSAPSPVDAVPGRRGGPHQPPLRRRAGRPRARRGVGGRALPAGRRRRTRLRRSPSTTTTATCSRPRPRLARLRPPRRPHQGQDVLDVAAARPRRLAGPQPHRRRLRQQDPEAVLPRRRGPGRVRGPLPGGRPGQGRRRGGQAPRQVPHEAAGHRDEAVGGRRRRRASPPRSSRSSRASSSAAPSARCSERSWAGVAAPARWPGRRSTAAQSARLDSAQQRLAELGQDAAELEQELQQELAAIDSEWDQKAADVSVAQVRLEKTDVSVAQLALVWIPTG